MTRLLLLFATLIIISCGSSSTNGSDSVADVDSSTTNFDKQVDVVRFEGYTLYEDSIQGVALPFERKEMLDDLNNNFDGMTVTKETGQQDGPDFRLYSVKDGNQEICIFAMNSDDTLDLDEVLIKQPIIQDQYGLRVGDSYRKVKELRNGAAKTYTDYHQHTFAYFEKSRVMYEITGDLILPDTVDLENITLTEDQIKDWKIEYLIWRKE